MGETKAQREAREAEAAAAAAATTDAPEAVPAANDFGSDGSFKLAEEGFDVTQPPPSDLDGQSVDYKKTTMPVVGDASQPEGFDPNSNR